MNKLQLNANLLQFADESSDVIIFFRDTQKPPLGGRLLLLDDAEELFSKRMIRYVNCMEYDRYGNTGDKKYTRIISIENILDIKKRNI